MTKEDCETAIVELFRAIWTLYPKYANYGGYLQITYRKGTLWIEDGEEIFRGSIEEFVKKLNAH